MYRLFLYQTLLSVVSSRLEYNDKFLNIDKISENDTIYFEPIRVHVIYDNKTESDFKKYGVDTKEIREQVRADATETYIDNDTTPKTYNNVSTETGDDENVDFGGLRFTTISCEVNGQHGVCAPNSYFCRNLNGVVISVSGNNGGCGILPCCQILQTCGSSTNKKISHFVNPDDKVLQSSCSYTINVMNDNVCQIRLDFLTFELARPRQQSDTINTPISCRDDALVINPSNGFRVPIICGYNTGQHLYLPINASNGEKIVFMTMFLAVKRYPAFPNPHWKIRITQYECPNNPLASNQSPRPYKDFIHLAPPGCLQYFTNRVGTVCNLGFQSGLDYIYNFYPSNIKYAICFKRYPSTCGIKFTTQFFMLSSNNDCTMGDYLFIPGAILKYDDKTTMTNSRLCGNELPVNADILSYLEGPLYIQFESDNIGNNEEHGFCLDYEAPPASGCV